MSGATLATGAVFLGLGQRDQNSVSEAPGGSSFADFEDMAGRGPRRTKTGIALLSVGAAGVLGGVIWQLNRRQGRGNPRGEPRPHGHQRSRSVLRSGAIVVALFVTLLGGCDVVIPNGLFGCGQQSDCPAGYFCWGSDSRCYDAQEPGCLPKSCDQVISEFASLGIPIECGSLPNGCDGSIDCGLCQEGSECGANGQNFMCGCEELTCATFGEGAECGTIQTRCGGTPTPIECGECFGQQVCVNNQCECPQGVNCDAGCGTCADDEVCVDGECCAPTFPCSQNECSPPGGLDDGCGGTAECPPCGSDEECVLSDERFVFECLGDCTCEAQGVECGNANICGDATLCGTCQDNGFEEGFRCKGGECVCEDPYESNDTLSDPAVLCGGTTGQNCLQEAWAVNVDATLHAATDMDFYAIEALDAETVVLAELSVGAGSHTLLLSYVCGNGESGVTGCSGETEVVESLKFCVSDTRNVGMTRSCNSGELGQTGAVVVGVRANALANECAPYTLNVLATYDPSGVEGSP